MFIGCWVVYCIVSYCVYAKLVVGEYFEVALCVFLSEGHCDGCQLRYVDRASFFLLFYVNMCDVLCSWADPPPGSQCIVAFDL
jgi:hypothetical protein